MNPTTDTPRLLVVEDEQHLAKALKLNFELEGFSVDVAGSARQAGIEIIREQAYDAIVLDVMLPDLSGFDLCRKIRESGNYTPVIMLTVRAAADDRVLGLEAGADDYLVKPFEFRELLARVRSMIRRRHWERSEDAGESTNRWIHIGEATIDLDTHVASVDGQRFELTRLELDLVRYFAENPHRALSREELLEEVWKLRNYPNTRTVDNFIVRLRRYFEPDPSKPTYFVSVRGTGYKFVPAD